MLLESLSNLYITDQQSDDVRKVSEVKHCGILGGPLKVGVAHGRMQ
jgi:hypothetical protein